MFPVIALFAVISSVAAASDDPVLRAADQEVERAMEVFSSMERAPYFLGVEITETHRVDLVGEYGGLQPYEPSAIRWVDVDVRLGDRNFDSTHPLRSASDSNQKNGRRLALGDDVTVIQRGIWSEVRPKPHQMPAFNALTL